MKILIVEDEAPAAARLKQLISEVEPESEVVAVLDSVKSVVKWCAKNSTPDVAFFDIQLADGLSFEIFDWIELDCPIIFCTAYDEYAIKAFKLNSIDYLLKPADADDISNALAKFKRWKKEDQTALKKVVEQLSSPYKERFLVKIGEHIRTIPVADVLYFYSMEKATFCITKQNQNYLLDPSLEKVESMVNPKDFFRVNRKYLIGFDAIQDIVSYSNSRLRVVLKGSKEMDCIVAREKVNDFKAWLDS